MPVEYGDTVVIEYVGRRENGEIFDTSERVLAQQEGLLSENPDRVYKSLEIELGGGAVLPGLEDALIGMEIGEQARVTLPPEKAYGEPTDERVRDYDREAFEEMLGDRELVAGFEVEADSGLGGRVVEIGDETVTVDFNHELAGETLIFDIEVVEIEQSE